MSYETVFLIGNKTLASDEASGWVVWPGGAGLLEVVGTFGTGATLTVQMKAADGTTALSFTGYGVITGQGMCMVNLPYCELRLLAAIESVTGLTVAIKPQKTDMPGAPFVAADGSSGGGGGGGGGDASAANQTTMIASLSTIDDWDESDRAKANIIVGQAGVTAGAGAVAANTPRVTLASDDPAVTLITATNTKLDAAIVVLEAIEAGGGGGGGDASAANQTTMIASLSVLDDWDETDRAKVNIIVGQAGIAAGAGAVGVTVPRVTLASDDPGVAHLANVVTAVQIMDDWDESDRAKVNIIAGQAGVAAGAGAVDALTPRVTLASDDPGVAHLANIATSASVLDDWDEADRAKVNIIVGQAGVAAGAGAVGVTVPRVTLASDDPGVVSLQIIDDWDESDRAKVNVIAGQAGITAGAGAVAANTPRVTHASDDPVTTALQIIDDWDESDRAKVNPIVGQAGVAGGAGAVAATVQRVTLASDDPAVTSLGNVKADEYELVAASASTQTLGATGAAGDYLAGVLIVPETTTPGSVAIKDGAGTAIDIFVSSTLNSTIPFFVPLGIRSTNGAWQITTGSNVHAIGVGNFTT